LHVYIADVGGQMGLCLGASIMTFTELGEFIFIVIYNAVRKFGQAKQIGT